MKTSRANAQPRGKSGKFEAVPTIARSVCKLEEVNVLQLLPARPAPSSPKRIDA
jgi:hypothetical protein